jgi:hypothetical protein
MVAKIIDFIKSTAFILGYLFAVATAYYLSFWSYFDIDVFQFISVEDIIKGIAYPLRFADIGLIGIFLFFVIVFTIIALIKFDTLTRWVAVVIIAIIITPALWVLYYFKYSNASAMAGLGITTLVTMLLIVLYQISDDAHEEDKKNAAAKNKTFTNEHPLVVFRNTLISFSLIFFPINAIIAGQVNARDIHDGKKYNYIMRQDLPQEKVKIRFDFLIFLGAVSEKYIFLNKNEDERFVIDKDELPTLRVNHFDSSDKESVNHLSANLLAQSQDTTKASSQHKVETKPDAKAKK